HITAPASDWRSRASSLSCIPEGSGWRATSAKAVTSSSRFRSTRPAISASANSDRGRQSARRRCVSRPVHRGGLRSGRRCDRGGGHRAEQHQVGGPAAARSEEHTSELQSRGQLVCRLLLEKKKRNK